MNGKQFQQSVDYVLLIGVFKKTEHDAVDGLYEVIAFVLNIARSQLLYDFSLVLVLIDKLCKCKASSETQQLTDRVDYVRAFYTVLQQSDLGDQSVWRILSPCSNYVMDTSEDGPKDELGIHGELIHDFLRILLEESIEEVHGLVIGRHQLSQLLSQRRGWMRGWVDRNVQQTSFIDVLHRLWLR